MSRRGIRKGLHYTLDEAHVLAAHTMLGIPLAGEALDLRPRPTDAERAAPHDRLPKRMQDRIGETEGERLHSAGFED